MLFICFMYFYFSDKARKMLKIKGILPCLTNLSFHVPTKWVNLSTLLLMRR